MPPLPPQCAELVTRELLNALLWCESTQQFDATRLPATARHELRTFYGEHGAAHEARQVMAGTSAALSPAPHATQRVRVAGRSVAEWFDAPPTHSNASKEWFEMVSGVPRVTYLRGGGGSKRDARNVAAGQESLRYEMAPTLENVALALGHLFGQPSIASIADLEAFWAAEHPERGVRLRVGPDGARLWLVEPTDEQKADAAPLTGTAADAGLNLRVTLEVVVSPDLNHAFAVHNWQPRQWQHEVAAAALACMRTGAGAHGFATSAGGDASVPKARPSALPLLHGALMPSLLQPLLPLDALPPGSDSPRNMRLALLSTSPRDAAAIGFSFLRLMSAVRQMRLREAVGVEEEEKEEEEAVSLGVAARLLSVASCGLEDLSDANLLRVAGAAAAAPGNAVHAMAMKHPPLAAPAAVLRPYAHGSGDALWRSCMLQQDEDGAGAERGEAAPGTRYGISVQRFLRNLRCTRLSIKALPMMAWSAFKG